MLKLLSHFFGDEYTDWVIQRNKLVYLIGTIYILASAFLIGFDPCSYPKFSATGTAVLLFFRIFHFYSKNWHLYLIDFCYVGNLIFIVVSHFDSSFANICFLYSFIMLSSVVTFRNSLLPHSFEIFMNCYIHINPAVSMVIGKISKCYDIQCSLVHVQAAVEFYSFYAICYLVLMFILLKKYWKEQNVPNLYSYMSNAQGWRLIFQGRPDWAHGILFMLTHGVYNITWIFFGYLVCPYENFLVLYTIAHVMYSIYNAGNYYVGRNLSKSN